MSGRDRWSWFDTLIYVIFIACCYIAGAWIDGRPM